MAFMKRKTIALGGQFVSELTILEWKRFFSIKLFKFHKTDGSQDRFHTHGFSAVSILLKGDYTEEIVVNNHDTIRKLPRSRSRFLFIPRNSFHRITKSVGCTTLLITGPWKNEFMELRHVDGNKYTRHLCGLHRVDLMSMDGFVRLYDEEETSGN